MKDLLRRIWIDDDGQDLAEYAILLGVILLLTVATVNAVGGDVSTIFSNAEKQLKGVGK
ncbi:MAG TPA: hypothetical protein VNR20_03110 [Terriglobales bacterium]|nr:hypothetical protein [Terriglobales bacterium]